MPKSTLKQKCIDAGINYTNVRSYKSRHKDLSLEQVFEYYKNNAVSNYASIRTGKKSVATNSLEMTIIKYKNCHDIDIQLEDGTIIQSRTYADFKTGYIAHPKYVKCKYIFTRNDEKYFLCTCKKCKGYHVLPLHEMKDYECEYCTK